MLRESLLLFCFVILTNYFVDYSLRYFFFIEWFPSSPILSTLNYIIDEKRMLRKFFRDFILELQFQGHGANILIIEPTVIWEMLLLCELLLLVGFVAMNNFFLIIALSIDFLVDWLPSQSVSSTVVYVNRTKSFLAKNPLKFNFGSSDSASKLLTITP